MYIRSARRVLGDFDPEVQIDVSLASWRRARHTIPLKLRKDKMGAGVRPGFRNACIHITYIGPPCKHLPALSVDPRTNESLHKYMRRFLRLRGGLDPTREYACFLLCRELAHSYTKYEYIREAIYKKVVPTEQMYSYSAIPPRQSPPVPRALLRSCMDMRHPGDTVTESFRARRPFAKEMRDFQQ